jgi:hypothetical protein
MEKGVKGKKKMEWPERNTIRKAFRPLGIAAKVFGLFPCFDLSFTRGLSSQKLRVIHILDYAYSGLMLLLMAGGAVLCSVLPPVVLEEMSKGNEVTDSYVVRALFYISMFMGVMSLSIFPKKFALLLHYIEHFSSIDKLLEVGEEGHRKEERFGRYLLAVLFLNAAFVTTTFYLMFGLERPEIPKPVTDYLLIPIQVLAAVAHLIPTSLLIFFMNAIRLRLHQYNLQVKPNPLSPYSLTAS